MKNNNTLNAIISFILISVFTISAASCSKKEKTPQDSIINYFITYEPETLDPQIADDPVSDMIIMNIYEGLVRLDKNDDIVPGAAGSWDIDTDKLKYTFHLRDDLKWNDGQPLTADDFVFGIKRSVSKQTGSPTAASLFCIKNAEKINSGSADLNSLGITAPDKKTVIIELEYQYPGIMNILTTPPAMPCSKKFFEASVGQYGRADDKILCNGAFCINEGGWETGDSIYLKKNDNYSSETKAVPAGVKLSIVDETPEVCSSIIDAEYDCGAINNSDLSDAKKNGLNLTAFDDVLYGISFNYQHELLSNQDIRHALLSSVDRKNLLKNLSDDCMPSPVIIPDAAEIEGISYREKAGSISYKPDENPSQLLSRGMAESDITGFPNLTILCPDDENTQAIVSNLIEKWNSFTGAYFNKKPMSKSELQSRIKSGSYQIAIVPIKISGTTPLDTLEQFTAGHENNPCSFNSDEYDNMINDLKKSFTKDSVGKIMEAEEYLIRSAVFYPLYIQNRYYASAKNVTNVIFHAYGGDIDFIAAKKIEES